jgi:stress-induced-phosphoprotein 1
MALPEGLKDCEEALKLKPDFIKAFLRKGQIHSMMKEYQKAIKTYNDALEKDPENQEIIEAANKTMQLISNRTQSDPESVKKIVEKDPELQAILTDPVMQQVLREAQENPQSLNNYMNDTRIRDNLTKLFAAGILGRN